MKINISHPHYVSLLKVGGLRIVEALKTDRLVEGKPIGRNLRHDHLKHLISKISFNFSRFVCLPWWMKIRQELVLDPE